MQQVEIEPPYTGTATHPHVAVIAMDPTDVGRFVGMAEDQPDVRLMGIDKRTPDRWIVFAACASRDGRSMLESQW